MISRWAGLAICLFFAVATLFVGTGCDPCSSCSSTTKKTATPSFTPTFTFIPSPTPTATATATATRTATPTATPTTIMGMLQGGLSPVSGAAVTLYAAGSAYGANATVLATATSDSSGDFTLTYGIPGTPEALYVVALGGSVVADNKVAPANKPKSQAIPAAANSAIGLMGLVGLSNAVPTSFTVNELTTVAAEWALAQFTDATGQIIGAPSSNAIGFGNALAQSLANLADITTGEPAIFWSNNGVTEASCTGDTPPVNCDGLERMNTIANILASCVQSSSSSSAPCTTLFANTAGTTTLQAAHVMATNPVANVATLFTLQSESPPFAPNLGTAPDGWEIALNLDPGSTLDGSNFLAIDAAGNVWVPNFDGNSVTELSPIGTLVGNFAPAAADFNESDNLAIDAVGNVWVGNFSSSSSSVSELLAGCSTSSCTGLNFTPAGANFASPQGVAIDTSGNVWVVNPGNNSVTKLTSGGALVGNFTPQGSNFDLPQFLAIDTAGNVWVTNIIGDSVTELTSSGGLGGNFAPAGAAFDDPGGIAIDTAGNFWIPNEVGNTVSELLAGCSTAACTGLNFSPAGANLNESISIAIDSANHVWATNAGGNSVTELTSSGGLAGNFAPAGAGFNAPDGLGIDASGNVWMANAGDGGNSVSELIGAARPVLTPKVACLKKAPASAVCLP
jgi:streptogramin lyase